MFLERNVFEDEKGLKVILSTAVEAHYYATIMERHSEYTTSLDQRIEDLNLSVHTHFNERAYVTDRGNLCWEISIWGETEEEFLRLRNSLWQWITDPNIYKETVQHWDHGNSEEPEEFMHKLSNGTL